MAFVEEGRVEEARPLLDEAASLDPSWAPPWWLLGNVEEDPLLASGYLGMAVDLDPNLPRVVCSSQGIGQVLLNLVVNAAHAVMDVSKGTERSGKITIETRSMGDLVRIRVMDNGSGIPPHARDHVFEPFFTTKSVGKGTGQGLFIAHRVVVKEHGGGIRFETESGQGTTFIISLPVAGRVEDFRRG